MKDFPHAKELLKSYKLVIGKNNLEIDKIMRDRGIKMYSIPDLNSYNTNTSRLLGSDPGQNIEWSEKEKQLAGRAEFLRSSGKNHCDRINKKNGWPTSDQSAAKDRYRL